MFSLLIPPRFFFYFAQSRRWYLRFSRSSERCYKVLENIQNRFTLWNRVYARDGNCINNFAVSTATRNFHWNLPSCKCILTSHDFIFIRRFAWLIYARYSYWFISEFFSSLSVFHTSHRISITLFESLVETFNL